MPTSTRHQERNIAIPCLKTLIMNFSFMFYMRFRTTHLYLAGSGSAPGHRFGVACWLGSTVFPWMLISFTRFVGDKYLSAVISSRPEENDRTSSSPPCQGF